MPISQKPNLFTALFLEFWARLIHAAMIGISTVLSQEWLGGAFDITG